MNNFKEKYKCGQSLVEILLAFGLMFILLPALLTGFVASREGKAQQNKRVVALPLLTEAQEAVRSIRENGWSAFAVNGTYHPVVSGSTWSLVSGTETINGLVRSVVISNANRDTTTGAIVTTGGTPDPSTKKVVVTLSWSTPYTSSLSSIMYLTRRDNVIYTETTQAHFDAGTLSSVTTTNVINGEVQLGAGGRGDWCQPNLNYPQVDLPKSGVANAVTAIEGKVFAGTGDNAAGVSFAKVDITNPAYPASPSASIDKTFDGYKTNSVFGESSYAYLATDNNGKEVVIINLNQTNPTDPSKYKEEGYFNAPGNGNGNSVYASGSIGYMTDGSGHLYTFDLSSHSGSRSQKGSYTLAATGNKVTVNGSYAYIANNSTTNQLEIVDVSNPNSPVLKKRFSVDGLTAKDIYINSLGSRAYLATTTSSTKKELFIIDISDKSNPVVKGSYEANGMDPKGVTAVTNNKVLLVGTGAEEYQVIDVTTETSPARCSGLNIDTGVNGVAGVLEADGDAYSYIITGDASSELKIIAGGAGIQYSSSGDFTSKVATISATATFNRVTAELAQPSATSIRMQVAGADQVSGSCTGATYNFVGPDKTAGTYFTSSDGLTISGSLPFDDDGVGYENPARCFKYKAYFTSSDITQTPVLYTVTVNYSP